MAKKSIMAIANPRTGNRRSTQPLDLSGNGIVPLNMRQRDGRKSAPECKPVIDYNVT
jgi:hypothetical protein